MATVNLTCTACSADEPCERCRAIAGALRAAGHSITQSSRYDALRAATVGTYGFEACVLPIARHERAIVDAASALLRRARVALVVEPGALSKETVPTDFAIIETADWRTHTFPTEWIAGRASLAAADPEETRSFEEPSVPPSDVDSARRRLKSIARRVQADLGVAGFPHDARLDLLAALEDEIAWAKMSGACFGLALIHAAGKRGGAAAPDVEPELAFLRERISAVVRFGDIISQGSDCLLVIIAEATMDQAGVATSRIKKAVRKAAKDAANDEALPALKRITLGISVYPTHGTTRAALLARATAAAEPI